MADRACCSDASERQRAADPSRAPPGMRLIKQSREWE
jgi:hypothetical protein